MWANTGGIWVSRETIRSRVIPGRITLVRCALGERLQTPELGTRVRARRGSKPAQGTTTSFRKTSFCPRKSSWEQPWRVPLRKCRGFLQVWQLEMHFNFLLLTFLPQITWSHKLRRLKKRNKSHFNGLQQNFKNHFKTETLIFFTLDLLGPQHTLVPL